MIVVYHAYICLLLNGDGQSLTMLRSHSQMFSFPDLLLIPKAISLRIPTVSIMCTASISVYTWEIQKAKELRIQMMLNDTSLWLMMLCGN